MSRPIAPVVYLMVVDELRRPGGPGWLELRHEASGDVWISNGVGFSPHAIEAALTAGLVETVDGSKVRLVAPEALTPRLKPIEAADRAAKLRSA